MIDFAGVDVGKMAGQIKAPAGVQPVASWGTVVAVDAAAGTCTVLPSIGTGPGQAIADVRYALPYPPRPGSTVMLTAQMGDLIVWGQLAPEGPPVSRVYRDSTLAVADITIVTVPMNKALADPWGCADGTGVVCPATGLYDLEATCFMNWSGGTRRDVKMYVNGVQVGEQIHPAGAVNVLTCSLKAWPLTAGDSVTARVYSNSGTPQTLPTLLTAVAGLTMAWAGHRRPARALGAELLANAGIESGSAVGWSYIGAGVVTDETVSMHGGAKAIKIVNASATSLQAVTQTDAIEVTPGERYDLSAWVKTASGLAGTSSNGITFGVISGPTREAAGYNGTLLAADGVLTSGGTDLATSTSWVQKAGKVVIPAGHRFARPTFRSYSSAGHTIYWDDMSMKLEAVL